MNPDPRLLTLLERWEELTAEGRVATPDELCPDDPVLCAELKRQIDQLQHADAAFRAAPTATNPTLSEEKATPWSVFEAPVAIGLHFDGLRQHARGGLGEVLVAEEERLGRRVAIKRMQHLSARSSDGLRRFVREARITAQLEHPGIVPVHGLGETPDGRPCYAMRFVQGQKLRETVDQFHRIGSTEAPESKRHVAFRELLLRFVAVCQTIAYAHSRGVIHRDLKPDNIMIGPYGETLVLDWGLARFTAEDKTASAGISSSTHDGEQEKDRGQLATVDGQVLGTPAYMSPEQATGRNDLVGPAADIYSLGAVLYYILTAKSPFDGHQIGEMLWRVGRGEFKRPRQLRPAIPIVLEAICLKAMALRPGDRYPDAAELAADVDRWLGDEAVSVVREPLSVRAIRWARKHRSTTTGVGVLLLATIVAFAIGLYFLNAEKTRTEKARQEAEQQATAARLAGEREKHERENAQQIATEKEAEAYDAFMILAHREWERSQTGRVRQILQMFEPTRIGQRDLRGFEWYYFDRLARPERYERSPGWSMIASSPDGKRLAGISNGIAIWSAESRELERTIGGTGDGFQSAEFDKDGKRLVACAGDKTVRVYDLANGKATFVFREHGQGARSACFTPDGTRVVSRGPNPDTKKDDLVVWQADSGKVIFRWSCDPATVTRLAVSPDGKILYATDKLRIAQFDLVDGKSLPPVSEATFGAVEFALSPDGLRMAVGNAIRRVWFIDTVSGKLLYTFPILFGFPLRIAFNPSGDLLAVTGNNSLVHLFDVASAKEVRSFRGDGSPSMNLAFARGESLYLASSFLGNVKIWDVQAGLEFRDIALGQSEDELAVSPAGTKAVVSERTTGGVALYDLPSWKFRVRLSPKTKSSEQLAGLRFSADGRLVAQVRTGCAIEFYHDQPLEREPRAIVSSAEARITCGDFAPDGQHFATGHHDGTIRVHDLFGSDPPIILGGNTGSVRVLTYHPTDSNILVSGGEVFVVRVWDIAERKNRNVLKGHSTIVFSLAFSDDGKHLVSAGMDASVILWETSRWTIRHLLHGHSGLGIRAVFNPEGNRVATCDKFSNTLRLFDVATGRETLTLPNAHPNPLGLTAPVFVPGGRVLIAAGSYQVRLYETAADSPREQLRTIAVTAHLGELQAEAIDSSRLRLSAPLVSGKERPIALPSRSAFGDCPMILRAWLEPVDGEAALPVQTASSFYPTGPVATFDLNIKNVPPGRYRAHLQTSWSKAIPQLIRGPVSNNLQEPGVDPISEVTVEVEIPTK